MAEAAAARKTRKQRTGQVVSHAMDKTIVVKVTRQMKHARVHKHVRVARRFYAHDEKNSVNPGDKVIIEETRPLSKLKRWRVLEVTTPAAVGSA